MYGLSNELRINEFEEKQKKKKIDVRKVFHLIHEFVFIL